MKYPTITATPLALLAFAAIAHAAPTDARDPFGILLKPVPDKTVVLTFDDGVASHATQVAPILKKAGFGGSFYVADFDCFNTRKDWYMTWAQIQSLVADGFDVGNHTKGHGGASLDPWLNMETEFAENHVPKPVTLAWPVYAVYAHLYPSLIEHHYTFGRAGGDRPYQPAVDHPLNVPSFSPRDVESFIKDAQLAAHGQMVVFTFHGVPEGEHMAVSLDPEKFATMMKYLKDNQYHVISLRDVARYVDVKKADTFLPFPDRYPWGGMIQCGDLLYVTIGHLPADRKVTLPGITTRIARAWFAEDARKQALKVAVADNGLQTLDVPQSPLASPAGGPVVIVAQLKGGPVATMLEFVIPGAPEAVITGNDVRVTVPLAADLTKLAPRYRTGSPLVTGKPVSGSVNDLSRPQSYVITAPDGTTRKYLVTVTKVPGAAVVTNPGFEQFDTTGDYDMAKESNPTGATWVFKKENGNGELGIRDLKKGGGAPPAPDGSRHCAFMRGTGNGVSQTITFDKGNYTVTLDAVKRSGYEKTAAALLVTLDGSNVFTIAVPQITEKWASYTSPPFPVSAGPHTFAITLGEGGGMDMIDNVRIHYQK